MQAGNRKNTNRPASGNKLSEEEWHTIVDVCNSDRFNSLLPSQIIPILADEGEYVGILVVDKNLSIADQTYST